MRGSHSYCGKHCTCARPAWESCYWRRVYVHLRIDSSELSLLCTMYSRTALNAGALVMSSLAWLQRMLHPSTCHTKLPTNHVGTSTHNRVPWQPCAMTPVRHDNTQHAAVVQYPKRKRNTHQGTSLSLATRMHRKEQGETLMDQEDGPGRWQTCWYV